MARNFTKPFTQQEPLSDDAIHRVTELLQTSLLHRYNTMEGKSSEAELLESEYARFQGQKYCIACTSGGFAIQTALRAAGVQSGDKILANAFTLAPVPGAIHNVGATPIFVEIDDHYRVDFDDLEIKAKQSRAKFFLLSLMRGHLPDMEKLARFCQINDITLIEDCAHTMGAKWNGKLSGNFGAVAAFSTQTYKHINSGEGGLLVTNDEDIAAKAIIMSGSYMLYDRHGTCPPGEVMERHRLTTPNFSGRMDNLRACLIRMQLPHLETNIERWNKRYDRLAYRISKIDGLEIPKRVVFEYYVGSSIQFRAPSFDPEQIQNFIARVMERGVELKWFGEPEPKGFTSRYDSWQYIKDINHLPRTLDILATTLDMRIPLTFTLADCDLIADILEDVTNEFMT